MARGPRLSARGDRNRSLLLVGDDGRLRGCRLPRWFFSRPRERGSWRGLPRPGWHLAARQRDTAAPNGPIDRSLSHRGHGRKRDRPFGRGLASRPHRRDRVADSGSRPDSALAGTVPIRCRAGNRSRSSRREYSRTRPRPLPRATIEHIEGSFFPVVREAPTCRSRLRRRASLLCLRLKQRGYRFSTRAPSA
jgi:hypothetical protein